VLTKKKIAPAPKCRDIVLRVLKRHSAEGVEFTHSCYLGFSGLAQFCYGGVNFHKLQILEFVKTQDNAFLLILEHPRLQAIIALMELAANHCVWTSG
jgi:hypothetical protein